MEGDPPDDPTARDWAVRGRAGLPHPPAHCNAQQAGHRSTPTSAPSTTSPAAGASAWPRPSERTCPTLPSEHCPNAPIRWLRAAGHASTRHRALALAGLNAGLRIAETVALDLADVRTSARKVRRHLVVRYGKGGHYREVPLHPVLRTCLETWLKVRRDWPGADTPAVFLNRRAGRLSTRGVYNALAAIAGTAGIDVGRDAEFTPHVLRHTAGTTMTGWVFQ